MSPLSQHYESWKNIDTNLYALPNFRNAEEKRQTRSALLQFAGQLSGHSMIDDSGMGEMDKLDVQLQEHVKVKLLIDCISQQKIRSTSATERSSRKTCLCPLKTTAKKWNNQQGNSAKSTTYCQIFHLPSIITLQRLILNKFGVRDARQYYSAELLDSLLSLSK